jgi:hypothetical protein
VGATKGTVRRFMDPSLSGRPGSSEPGLGRGRDAAREGHAPVVAVLSRDEQTSLSLPPKGVNHGPCSLFPCKTAIFEGAAKGAIMRSWSPLGRTRGSSVAEAWTLPC